MIKKCSIITAFLVSLILLTGIILHNQTSKSRQLPQKMHDPESVSSIVVGIPETKTNADSNSVMNINEQTAQFIDEKEAVEIAKKRVSSRSSCDINTPPEVTLINGYYEIKFWSQTNPFWNSPRSPDNIVRVNAVSGEAEGMRVGFGGVQIFSSDPKSNPGATPEEKETFKLRMQKTLLELTKRVREGSRLYDDASSDMVSANDAVQNAVKHISSCGRIFSARRHPSPILVENTYVVVFWRDQEFISDNSPTYDSRIGIDAHTGEVIGMEITRY